ncbi:MAG: DUF1460 domain-containing protein [Candidatus Mycalebacterium zealandia]|nr:MAG: DUF1460 domain-containing protein [Candidatus Mycalebacterium zealandia]
MTRLVGKVSAESTKKTLNKKPDGTNFLDKIPERTVRIWFIKPENLSPDVIDRLQTGDYAGIYATAGGLGVTHTGIIIKKGNTTYLRHASSRKELGKVADEEITAYIKGKPGLTIFRPIGRGEKDGGS